VQNLILLKDFGGTLGTAIYWWLKIIDFDHSAIQCQESISAAVAYELLTT